MKHLKYYLRESSLVKGKFMPVTLSVNTYNDDELIKEMMIKDRNITENEIKRVLKLLISTSENILSKGNNILIPDFLKISPIIQGAFSTPEESFDPKKHNVSLNFAASPVFMKNFQKKIKVQKTDKKRRHPYINAVLENKTGENAVRRDYANFIRGNYLIVSGKEFSGISLTLKDDTNLTVIIEKTDLDIISYSSKEIVFNITRGWAQPAWLESGREIYIMLRYTNANGHTSETEAFKTKWE